MKLAGYIRVSRIGSREGEGFVAPEIQREGIRIYAEELAATNGGELELSFVEELDVSGGTMARPKFQEMLASLEAGQLDGVVVHKIDRFARRAEAATIIRAIVDRGQIFASVVERIDPRTPTGAFMMRQFLSMGELFLDQISAGWDVSKERAVRRGVAIGPTPIGYLRPEKSKPLTIDPSYGPTITALFKRAATKRYSDSELARWMQTEAPPKGERREWQPSELRRWLANETYLGRVVYGTIPPNLDAHPPLTTEAVWKRCQRDKGEQHRAASPFLLRGLVRCAHCRYALSGATHGGAKGDTRIYRCSNSACDQRSVVTAARLEDHVVGLASEKLAGLREEADIDLDALDAALAAAETELAAFTSDLTARAALGDEAWQAALALRVKDRDVKQAERSAGYNRTSLSEGGVTLEELPGEAWYDLLHGALDVVWVRKAPHGATVADRTLLGWSDDANDLEVPGPHRSGTYDPVTW